MKKLLLFSMLIAAPFKGQSTIHEILIWDGYMQFLPASLEIQLGDTIQWLPLLGAPSMVHTITSSNIPVGAVAFDEIYQAPADTFFQYIPAVAGLYEYVCTPHIPMGMIGSFNVVSGAVGISETSIQDLYIYPNPTCDFLNIKNKNVEFSYRIWTTQGKLLLAGKTLHIIDVTTLEKGNFLLEIIGDKPRVITFTKI